MVNQTKTKIKGTTMKNQTRRSVNKMLRAKDDSHLWPINGAFNATNRAIARIVRQEKLGLVIDDIESYKAAIEHEIAQIVNNHI